MIAEWLPKFEQYGVQLRFGLSDIRNGFFSTDSSVLGITRLFEAQTQIGYMTFSPSGRYYFSPSRQGFYAFGGVDIEIPTLKQRRFNVLIDTGGTIGQFQRWIDLEKAPVRLGGHIGIGADFLIGESAEAIRMRLSPYISAHVGSTMAEEQGQAFGGIFLRAGVAVKAGLNEIIKSILPYDSTNITKPVELASLRRGGLIEFSFRSSTQVARAKPVELSIVNIEQSIAVNTDKAVSDEVREIIAKDTVKTDPCKDIKPDILQRYLYEGQRSAALTSEMKSYLDKIAACLQANPASSLQLIAHTDAFGSFAETQAVSDDRANLAVTYLLDKGIPRTRIFSSSLGVTQPIANNATEQGRAQNRALDIIYRTTLSAPPTLVAVDPCAHIDSLKRFAFANAKSTALTQAMTTYLDNIALCLQMNPKAGVQLYARTQSLDTPAETQQVMDQRASGAVAYLVNKGISQNRITANGIGTRNVTADTTTDIGRAQNHSLDILYRSDTTSIVAVAKPDPCKDITPEAIQRFLYASERSSVLTSAMKEYLDKVAACLQANPLSSLRLITRAETFGPFPETQAVSDERVKTALAYLQSKGIDRKRLFDASFGTTQAIGDNTTEQGRVQNRVLDIIYRTDTTAIPSFVAVDPCKDVPLNKAQRLLFEGQRATNLTPDMKAYLAKVAECLKQNPTQTITLTGRADNVGSQAEARRISEERAAAAAEFIASQGVATNRITDVGLGTSQPIANLNTEAGRIQNRALDVRVNTADAIALDTVRTRLEPVIAEQAKEKPKTKEEACKDVPVNVPRRFQFNGERSAVLTKQMTEYLDKVIECLKLNPDVTLRLIGRTDNFGSPVETQRLSESRATAAVNYLLSKGIVRRRLLDVGQGARTPIADMSTDRGRRENRSLEIQVVTARR